MSGVEGGRELGFVDARVQSVDLQQVFERAAAVMSFADQTLQQGARGVHDLGAGAVVERQCECGSGVPASLFPGPLHGVLDLGGQAGGAADIGHADVIVVHALDVADQVRLQKLHQEADFGLGPPQIVLKRKGVERQPGEIDAGGGFDDELDGFGALLVAEETLEGALAGPAAVAVHDDGNVARDAGAVKLIVDGSLVWGELGDPGGKRCVQTAASRCLL